MRIFHLITTLDVGGAEMHLLSQVRGQSARGHEVRIGYLKGRGTLAEDFLSAGAREVTAVGFGAGTLLRLWRRLRWAEVAHSHLLKADMLAAVVATLGGRRRRLLSGKHNDEQVLKRPVVSRIHGLLGNLPVRTVVLSDHVGRFIERHGRVPASKQVRIYYGLDPEPFEAAARRPRSESEALRSSLGIAPEEVVFTCVARFAPQKAHDVLLRAFADARARTPEGAPELRLLLVGDDPFGDGRRKAEAWAAELELGASVVFAGIRRDVPELLAASDAFVMSSLWEGLGLVFLEAMACGLPVLSTQVSAIPEVVVEGETGVLVPPGEATPLADAMLTMARDGAGRKRMGDAGRARVRERFGLQRMVEETLELYERVAAGEVGR